MREFTQLPDLLAEVAKDKVIRMGPAARYPARFILLDDFFNYLPLIEKLEAKKVDLANLMELPTSWFGTQRPDRYSQQPGREHSGIPDF